MAKIKKRQRSGRIGGDHGSIIDSAKGFVRDLQRCAESTKVITNITLGRIDSHFGIGRSHHRAKLTSTPMCLEVRVSGGGAQLIRVFTSKPEQATEEIRQAALGNGFVFEIDKRQRSEQQSDQSC